MQIRLLGTLEARVDDQAVALGGTKPRAVLAMLGLDANHIISADQLIEGLWGEQPPPSAPKMVQHFVWRLRRALPDGAGAQIVTRGRGYELQIEPESIDVCRFEALLTSARRAVEAGRPSDAARAALALWHGPALADVADEPFAAAEIRRLEDMRLAAAELAIDADLAGGRHQEVAAEIEALVRQDPLREHLHAQRMLSLYRCGRQADALEAYQEARRRLVEEVGLEPGAELKRLQDAILRHDPSLDVAPVPAELPRELDPHGEPALAGRDRELAWLRARWARARAGAGGIVTLIGPAGMGKTRLAAELAGEVHAGGYAVVGADAAFGDLDLPRPTLLVLEDADDSAYAALAYRVQKLSTQPVLTLVTAERDDGLSAVVEEALVLAPLDADAVRAVAAGYAPAGTGEIPVDRLLAASGGVPRRVHDVASAWALESATNLLHASAPRAAARRGELRAAEAGLADRVAELQVARARVDQLAPGAVPTACPFKGLVPFEAGDARYFCGRERLVADVVARLPGAPLLAVVGPSGSGKSSLVRAGLVPALAAGVLPGSERWRPILVRPGAHPTRSLRDAGFDAGTGDEVVLVVDQFEEVFTACREEAERAAFVETLVAAAESGRTALIVLAVRADFYGRCAAYPALARLLSGNDVLAGPMHRDELRRAITLPAERAGLVVEPQLADALVADVAGEPGALPLLSSALLELWQRRDGRHLRHAAYERTGGVRGAVARLAEAAYRELDPTQQAVAHRMFLRLAGEGPDGAVVRRRVPLGELAAPREEDLGAVLGALTERRLLTASTTTVEVAHEALLREWPRLRGWLADDAAGRRVHVHLADSAREWDARGRDSADVYRGARLAVAQEWRATHEPELNATERAFLDAGRAAGERAQRRLRVVLGLVAGLLVLALAGGLVALDQRSQARRQARVADAQRLGTQALTEPDLARSLLLARQGLAMDDGLVTRSNLLSALLRNPAALAVVQGPGGPLSALAVSPDGRTVAVGSTGGALELFDAATRRPVGAVRRLGSSIAALRFSPDGTHLAVTGQDSDNVGTHGFVEVFGYAHGRLGRRVVAADSLPIAVFGRIVFSPDSRIVATDAIYGDPRAPEHGDELLRWNARTGAGLGGVERIGAGTVPGLVGYLDGGRLLVSTTTGTTIRDATTEQPLRTFPAGGVATVSRDGHHVAIGAGDGSVRLLDLDSGAVRQAAGRHDGAVTSLAFTPDSRRLVSAGADGRVLIWSVGRAGVLDTFAAQSGPVPAVAVGPDGRTAYSAGEDGTVIAWDLGGGRGLARTFTMAGAGAPAVTPDGARFAVPSADGVDVFDSRTLARTRIDMAHGYGAQRAAIAPDGRTLAAFMDHDRRLGLWDLRTGVPIPPVGPALVDSDWSPRPSFSEDGRRLAYLGASTVVKVWDVRRRADAGAFTLDDPSVTAGPGITDAQISPSGRELAMSVEDDAGQGTLEVVALPGLRVAARVRMPVGHWIRFARDGRSLLYGDDQGRVWRFDSQTWQARKVPLSGPAGAIVDADVSPDGRMLATAGSDGTVRLWDLSSGRAIGTPLPGVAGQTANVRFVRAGTALLALYGDGRGFVWDLRPSAWARRACAVAGRTLTRAEWADALPGHPYRPACA